MMAVEETVGQRVRRLRLERGWSQHRLSAESGLHHSAVSRIESGENNPTARSVRDLARALGVEPKELMTRRGDA